MKRIYTIDGIVKFMLYEKCLINIYTKENLKLRSPAAFCLSYLLENHGRLVTYDELFQVGWNSFGMSASVNVLHNTMFYIRKSLKEIGGFDSKVIETINRRGFVFSLQTDVKLTYIDTSRAIDPATESGRDEGLITDSSDITMTELQVENSEGVNKKGLCMHSFTFVPICDFDKKVLLKKTTSPLGHKEKEKETSFIHKIVVFFNRHTKREIKLSFLISFLVMLTAIYGYNTINDVKIFHYVFKGTFDNCLIYQNSSSYDFNEISIMGDFKESCSKSKYLYLTYHPNANNLSAISCRSEISFLHENLCTSRFYFRPGGF